MQKRRLSQVGVEAVERLNLPPETAVGVPQVELYGNRQLYMAGHRGVISYSTEEVTVSGGRLAASAQEPSQTAVRYSATLSSSLTLPGQ